MYFRPVLLNVLFLVSFSCSTPHTLTRIGHGHSVIVTIPPSPAQETFYNPERCGERRSAASNSHRNLAPKKKDRDTTYFGEFPWMVLILKTSSVGEELLCGASLLSASVVLTAAHCVHFVDPTTLKIRAGEYDRSVYVTEPKPHQDRSVEKIITHDNYGGTFYNDLALIKVTESFVLDNHIHPICIPEKGSWYADDTIYNPNSCVATGWGRENYYHGQYSNTLKKVDLSLVPRDECQSRFRYQTPLGPSFELHSSFICAGGVPGHDTCKGDGGGPLVCLLKNETSRYVQVGVVAAGIMCNGPIPSLYASLEANIDWLTNQISLLTSEMNSDS